MSTLDAPARGRSIWSGLLRLSLVAVPVKAYPAVRSTNASHFHQLHADCHQRIRYEKRCPQHGPVDATAIVRGYAYAPDQFVVVEPEELEQLRPAQDQALILEQFLPVADIDPVFFAGRTLYLLPDGPAARHPYAVVAAAMREAAQGALGRVVLSGHRQLVLVRAAGRLLALDVLHYPAQVRAAADWDVDVAGAAGTVEEQRLARQLLDAAGGPVDWSRYEDRNAAELATLIEAKIANRPPPAATGEPVGLLQLLDALQQSVAAVQERSVPSKRASRPRPQPAARRARA